METNTNLVLDMKEEYIESFIANTKSNLLELRLMLAIAIAISVDWHDFNFFIVHFRAYKTAFNQCNNIIRKRTTNYK